MRERLWDSILLDRIFRGFLVELSKEHFYGERKCVGRPLTNKFYNSISSIGLGLTLAAMSSAALAQTESNPSPETTENSSLQAVYAPDDFTQFQPNTARDMVSRIPGFILQGGEGGERGFGQASLNILINGRRPSSKSSDARDILNRIPADSVTRIEIVDGASLDIPGLSGQVANIIAKSGSLSGSWRYAARFEEGTEPQLLEGALNLSGKRGNLDYVIGLELGQFTFTDEGPEQFFDGDGALIQDRFEDSAFQQQRPTLDVNLTLNRFNGDVANLNLSGGLRNRNERIVETFSAISPNSVSGISVGRNGEDEYSYEIGGDYSTGFDLWGDGGTLKLIGLHSLENSEFDRNFAFDETGEPVTTSNFLRDDVETEYIGRTEYTWASSEKMDWAFAAEAAFNKLDSETQFFVDNDLPDDDPVTIEETRLQSNITQSWALSDNINLQTSFGAEYSEISVPTSDAEPESFFRPKGFLSASYTLSPTYTWRGKIERSVGQLDFGTFVSTVNLTEGNANQGNATVPDQRWSGEIELERVNSQNISGNIRAFVDFIDDPLDRIPITLDDGSIVEGPGNLDSATIYGVSANMTWVMDSIGLKGMRLEADGRLSDSSIEDPVTNINRAINSTLLWNYDIELRHDIPNTSLTWEAEIEQSRNSRFFRVGEIFDTRFIKPETRLSFIHKDLLGMQWTVSLTNIMNFESRRERRIFSPDRSGDLLQIERFNRQRGRRFSISVTDSF
jgi:hypothetical protein